MCRRRRTPAGRGSGKHELPEHQRAPRPHRRARRRLRWARRSDRLPVHRSGDALASQEVLTRARTAVDLEAEATLVALAKSGAIKRTACLARLSDDASSRARGPIAIRRATIRAIDLEMTSSSKEISTARKRTGHGGCTAEVGDIRATRSCPGSILEAMRIAACSLCLLPLLIALAGCASERIDPHSPGDRCLYSCPDEMVCAGTTFPRGRHPNPGHCQLAADRCMVASDCRPRERCIRPGPAVGVCQPEGLL